MDDVSFNQPISELLLQKAMDYELFDEIDELQNIEEFYQGEENPIRVTLESHGQDIFDKIMALDMLEFKIRYRMTQQSFLRLDEAVIL